MVGALPLRLFANGHVAFIRRLSSSYIGVHATYSLDTSGPDSKRLRLKENGLWLNPDEPPARAVSFVPSFRNHRAKGIEEHVRALESHAADLRGAFGVALSLGAALAIPRSILCPCDRVWAGHDNVFSHGCKYPGSEESDFLPFICPFDHVARPSAWAAEGLHYIPWLSLPQVSRLNASSVLVTIGSRPGDGALRDWSSPAEIVSKLEGKPARVLVLRGNVARAFGGNMSTARRVDALLARALKPPEWCTECLPDACSKWVPKALLDRGRIVPTRGVHEKFCIQPAAPFPLLPRLFT